MSAHFSKCREERCNTITSLMKNTSEIPILSTPGDNEWNKYPNSSYLVANYRKYFIGIDNHWKARSSLTKLTKRSNSPPGNLVSYNSNVLFLALNMVGDHDSISYTPGSEIRLQHYLKWFEMYCKIIAIELSQS